MARLKLRETFKKIFKNILFDNSCSACLNSLDRDGYLCSKCLKKLKEESYLKNTGDFYFCFYYEKEIRNLILDFKIRNRKNSVNDLAYLIGRPLLKFIEDEKIDIVIPVPISEKRNRERGFNQVEYILEKLNIKYDKITRVKATKHMYALKTKEDREKNIEKSFTCNLKLSNKKVLIVDDIVTTGSTIKEICKEIRKNNENVEIKIFSVAMSRSFRGEMDGNIYR